MRIDSMYNNAINVVAFLMNTGPFVTGFASFCSVENVNDVVENAIVSCLDYSWCTATCYSGYIPVFHSGRKVESFSCQDNIWTPLLSACKRT